MFQCQNEFCKVTVPHRQPVNRIVTEKRQRFYERPVKRGHKIVDVEQVEGWEIVKEICVCPECYSKLTGKRPKMVVAIRRQPEKVRGFNIRPPRNKKWQNPKAKKASSHKEFSSGTTKASKNSGNSRKKPIIEKVNPIPLIKE